MNNYRAYQDYNYIYRAQYRAIHCACGEALGAPIEQDRDGASYICPACGRLSVSVLVYHPPPRPKLGESQRGNARARAADQRAADRCSRLARKRREKKGVLK